MNRVVVNGVDCSPDVIGSREVAHAEEVRRLREQGMSWERACEMAVMERDGAHKAAQAYHDQAAEAERLLLVHTSSAVKYQAALLAAEARCAELEGEARMNAETLVKHNHAWSERCSLAEERVAELEAALRGIADTQSNCGFCWDARHIARRALAGGGK